jgi:uncharacterized protein YjiS (DUF1127 family)
MISARMIDAASADSQNRQPGSNTIFSQIITALRKRQIRQQWQRNLQTLDDRQLHDIGISRTDAERTIERLRFWI